MADTEFMGQDSEGAVTARDCSSLIVYEDVYIYKKPNDNNSKSKKKIPAFTQMKVKYDFDDYIGDIDDGNSITAEWFYVFYDSEYYWVRLEDEKYSFNYGWIGINKILDEVAIYERPSIDSKKLNKTISSGKTVESIYFYDDGKYDYDDYYYSWEYIFYDGVEGWIPSKSVESIEDKKMCLELSSKKEKDDDKKEDKERNDEMTPIVKAVLAIGGAVILALVVIVTLVLINKKKNKNIEKGLN